MRTPTEMLEAAASLRRVVITSAAWFAVLAVIVVGLHS